MHWLAQTQSFCGSIPGAGLKFHIAVTLILAKSPGPQMISYGYHRYPGRLFVVEGTDGSGKSTQLALLYQWLKAEGYPVFFSEWNSSPLVKDTTRRAKKRRLFTPTTFSLLHATDFADRTERDIIPPLKAGAIVLADRYIYTAFARDVARGCGQAHGGFLFSRAAGRGDRSHRCLTAQLEILRSRHGHGLGGRRRREFQSF